MTGLLVLAGASLLALLLVAWSLVQHHDRGADTWVCATCLQGFGSWETAQMHMSSVHPRPR